MQPLQKETMKCVAIELELLLAEMLGGKVLDHATLIIAFKKNTLFIVLSLGATVVIQKTHTVKQHNHIYPSFIQLVPFLHGAMQQT